MPPAKRPTDLSALALTRGSSQLTTPASRSIAPRRPVMSEEAQHARQALQESSDLREQGHTDD